jgi:uncharacterized protein (TIGR03382 family)
VPEIKPPEVIPPVSPPQGAGSIDIPAPPLPSYGAPVIDAGNAGPVITTAFEPASMLLAGVGLLALSLLRRRRKAG